jgi:hypothetical protein
MTYPRRLLCIYCLSSPLATLASLHKPAGYPSLFLYFRSLGVLAYPHALLLDIVTVLLLQYYSRLTEEKELWKELYYSLSKRQPSAQSIQNAPLARHDLPRIHNPLTMRLLPFSGGLEVALLGAP